MSQRRTLTEAFTTGSPDEPALRVDAEAGVIFGVKVLGRFSRNSHGVAGATNGTEYALSAIRKAIPLYEGATVMTDHLLRTGAGGEPGRSVRDVFGKLRSVRLEGEDLRADLHYLKSKPIAAEVVEDVTRRLGVFGLSHNAAAGSERIDRNAGRLVIESIDLVRSVDLVHKPATNRNLWESTVADETKPTPKTISFRELLESQGKRWSKGRKLWADRLLEMDDMSAAVAAPVEVEADVEPDDALWSGFESAIMAVLGKYEAEELDAAGALAKIKELLTTHEKLDAEDEPDEPSDGTDADEDMTESEKSDADKAELAKLRREKQVRELCESLDYQPSKPQLAALVALEAKADRTALIEELKAVPAKAGVRTPRSGRVLKESQADDKASAEASANRLARLRGGY